METTATKTADGWTLNGSKTWISNAPVADLFVVWAREVDQGTKGKIRGFLVEKVSHDLDCAECRELPVYPRPRSRTNSPSGRPSPAQFSWRTCTPPSSCPNRVAWDRPFPVSTMPDTVSLGVQWGLWRTALLGQETTRWKGGSHRRDRADIGRNQFGRPLASFQLVQKKLADALTASTIGLLASLQLGRLKDSGKWSPDMVSMMKRNNCGQALEHARSLLDILGGNACADE